MFWWSIGVKQYCYYLHLECYEQFFVVYTKFPGPVKRVVIYWNTKWTDLVWVDELVVNQLYQRIGPQSKWGCPHFHHNVLLTLWIYTLVHWWLNNMNCEVLSRHTLSLSLIISSSSCHHNRCLPCCPSCTSQYNLPCGLMHQVLGVWMPWASSNNDAVTIPLP